MSEVKKFIVDGKVIGVPTVDETTVNLLIDNKVYNWARQPEKPEYTAEEVGALPESTTIPEYQEGRNIEIDGNQISAKGYTYDDDNDSFAIGSNSEASGAGAVSEGNQTVAGGQYSHVEGDWTLGILTEYDCELNDIGKQSLGCFGGINNINPDERGGTSSCFEIYKRNVGSRCAEYIREYILTITIEIPSHYQQMLNFNNAKIIYDNNEYYIKSYINTRYNASSTSESLTYDISLVYEDLLNGGRRYEHQYCLDLQGSNRGSTDFVVLTQVELCDDNNNLVELNNICHGKAKLIITESGVMGQASHAENGAQYITSKGSHAEGMNNLIHGDFSHAEGAFNNVLGTYCHAEGYSNTVDGIASSASGALNVIKGDGGHAFGTGLIVRANLTVIGKYNIEDVNERYAFIIGNGKSDGNRSNAFAVDWDGNYYN